MWILKAWCINSPLTSVPPSVFNHHRITQRLCLVDHLPEVIVPSWKTTTPTDEKERKDVKNALLSDSTFHTRQLTKQREGGKVCSLLLWQCCKSDVLSFCFCCCVSRYVRKNLK